jgi:hypothetical protein
MVDFHMAFQDAKDVITFVTPVAVYILHRYNQWARNKQRKETTAQIKKMGDNIASNLIEGRIDIGRKT